MVRSIPASLFSAVLLSGLVRAAPYSNNPDGDSALGLEVAVSAPNGIVMSDTAELARQLGTAFAPPATVAAPQVTASWPRYGAAPPVVAPPMIHQSMAIEPPMIRVTTTAMAHATSLMVHPPPAATSIMIHEPMVAPPRVEAPPVIYGSGSSSYVNGFDGCVQQCMAQFGPGAGGLTPPTPTQIGSVGGNGATHTVIVAPSQGVLRYVPFALNASVGDTIRFEWRADNHFVAKSSVLLPCNGTQDDAFFSSGRQNRSFIFNQVVNDTSPTFYFCATGTHCQQGMFGIINPPTSLVSDTSLGAMMLDIAQNNTELSSAWQATNSMTQGTDAFGWGNDIDMAQMPEWSYPLMAENVLYNRQLFSKNPEVIGADGTIDMGAARGPLMVPPNLNVALSQSTPATSPAVVPPANAGAATAGAGTPSAAPAADPQGAAAAPVTNGARSLGSSGAVVGVVAVLATLFAL